MSLSVKRLRHCKISQLLLLQLLICKRTTAKSFQNPSMAASGELLCSKAIHFFRIILHSTLHDGKLRIPRKFASRYGGGLPNLVFLKAPDGTQWKVYWKKHKGEIWFEDGCKEFVEYFSLDFGYFVMFRYEKGASTFEVIILDMSTLEIDYPSHEKGTQDESVEILEMPPRKKENRPNSPLKSLRSLEKLRTSTSGEGRGFEMSFGRASEMQNLCLNEKAKTTKQELEGAELHPTADIEKPERGPHNNIASVSPMTLNDVKGLRAPNKGKLAGKCSDNIVTSPQVHRRMQTSVENATLLNISSFESDDPYFRVLMQISYMKCKTNLVARPLSQKLPQAPEEAKSFSSENPLFRVDVGLSLVQRGRLSGRPTVPVVFLKNFMKSSEQNAMIQLGNRSGPATLRYYRHLPVGKLSVVRWLSFVEESKLQLGDVCIFELIDRESAVLKVHIFRSHT